MKKSFFFNLLFLFSIAAIAQTSLSGKITDVDTGEELIGANVTIIQNGNFVTGTSTDFDGNYKVNLDPGSYDIEIVYVGFPPKKITGVIITAEQDNSLNISLGGSIELVACPSIIYTIRLISKDNTTSETTLYSENIKTSPHKNINTIAGNAPGISFSW